MIETLRVHIGVHKTGSTAIQSYLWRNADALRPHGILYPAAGRPEHASIRYGHHHIPWFYLGRNVPDPMPALEAEIDGVGAGSVVVSSEEFDCLDSGQISRFAERCAAFASTVQVIFYYRRQSDVIQGLYGTDIIAGRELGTIQDYLETARTELDYLKLARQWSDAVGRANVFGRPYVGSASGGDDLITDFLETLSMPRIPDVGREAGQENLSLPWFAALTVQHMWRIGLPAPEIYAAMTALRAVCGEAHHGYEFLSPAQAAEFDRRFETSNRRFRDEFCAGHEVIAPRELVGDDGWAAAHGQPYAAIRQALSMMTDYVLAADSRRST